MLQEIQDVLRSIVDSFGASIGQPIRLQRFVAQAQELQMRLDKPAQTIAIRSVVGWHHWCGVLDNQKMGAVQYWEPCGDFYGTRIVHIPDLERITEKITSKNWSCDIQDVAGLKASKSKLETFSTLDGMVLANSPDMILPISDEKLRENLAHQEIRILPQHGGSDYFTRHMWNNGRIFLMNDGGSHHFAAARYIAARLQRPISLSGTLHTYTIRRDAVDSLLHNFDLHVIPKSEAYISIKELMQAFRAPFGVYGLPRPYEEAANLILLSRSHPRSVRVSKVLREAGLCDFGRFLMHVAVQQVPA